MITDIEIIDSLYDYIKGSELSLAITGGVYKFRRPKNSAKEDVVLTVIGNRNAQIQEAYVYVNIYFRGNDITHDGLTQGEIDVPRGRALARLATNLFEVGRGERFRFTIENQSIISNNDANEYIISNRLLYRYVNET